MICRGPFQIKFRGGEMVDYIDGEPFFTENGVFAHSRCIDAERGEKDV